MPFTPKTWIDRNVEFPSRRQLTPINPNDFTLVDVALAEGEVFSEGEAWNASNMNDLENRIAEYLNTTLKIESGTFTPDVNNYSIAIRTGTYYRIGELCFITIHLDSNSVPVNSNQVIISGLPYPAYDIIGPLEENNMIVGFNRGFNQQGTKIAIIGDGTSQIAMWVDNNGNLSPLTHLQSGAFELRISGVYRCAN
jgi:hypothetical protein